MSEPDGHDSSAEWQIRILLQLLEEEQRSEVVRPEEVAEADELGLPEIDLRTLLAEMIALKAAVRAEATASRDARDRFSNAVEMLENELSRARVREDRLAADWGDRLSIVGRRATLDLIELADRLEPAIERARHISQGRWTWLPWRRPDRAQEALVEGLELTWRRLGRQLEEQGVRRLSTVGERFDPNTMEAVERVERDDVDEGVVVQEVSAGYVCDEGRGGRGDDVRVVRVAQVVVNCNPDTMGA